MNRSRSEFRAALLASWTVATLVTLATVLAPYILTAGEIGRMTPRCARKAVDGRSCFFCGMTTGFIHMAHGRLSAAEQANRAAPPLYAGFAGNSLCLAFLLAKARLSATSKENRSSRC